MWMWLHQVLDLMQGYIWFNIGQPYIHHGLFQTLLSLHSKMQYPLHATQHFAYKLTKLLPTKRSFSYHFRRISVFFFYLHWEHKCNYMLLRQQHICHSPHVSFLNTLSIQFPICELYPQSKSLVISAFYEMPSCLDL